MVVDTRCIVTCSLGPVISGNVADSYVPGSGLIFTQGAIDVKGIITPDVGTSVTIQYTRNLTTRPILRSLKVLSSFADPFRRVTRVQLGCKLTEGKNKKERIKLSREELDPFFEDPKLDGYSPEDSKIITIPISASLVADKCLFELGFGKMGGLLRNLFSISEFDFSPGYIQVLNDLLVSENYIGYADEIHRFNTIKIDAVALGGPIFTVDDIIDIGEINSGDLVADCIYVSYNKLTLVENERDSNVDDWELDTTLGVVTEVPVFNSAYSGRPAGSNRPEYFIYKYIPKTETRTTYDTWDRVVKRETIQYSILAEVAPAYITSLSGTSPEQGPPAGNTPMVASRTIEITEYDLAAPGIAPTNSTRPTGYDVVKSRTTINYEPKVKLAASTQIYELADKANVNFKWGIANAAEGVAQLQEYIANKVIETNVSNNDSDATQIVKRITSAYKAEAFTLVGQQRLARVFDGETNLFEIAEYGPPGYSALNTYQSNGTAERALESVTRLKYLGDQSQITVGKKVALEKRPYSTARANAGLPDLGATSNNYRSERKSFRIFAEGAGTQCLSTALLSLPYASDDTFIKNGSKYSVIRSNSDLHARLFGQIQKRLMNGHRLGLNIKLDPSRMPDHPCRPFTVSLEGGAALYITDGTTYTFTSEGMIASTDGILMGGALGPANFFPVAPGVQLPTTLPTGTTTITGTNELNETVEMYTIPTAQPQYIAPLYNSTVPYAPTTSTSMLVVSLPYSLTPQTSAIELAISTKIEAKRLLLLSSPVAALQLSATAPRIATGARISVPAVQMQLGVTAPQVASGASVVVPAAGLTMAIVVPDLVGRFKTVIEVPAVGVTAAAVAPRINPRTVVNVPALNLDIGTAAPTAVGAYDSNFSSVSLLLHMNGSNNATTFTDNSSNAFTLTRYGDAKISTTQSKFGGSSGYFDGTGDYLTCSTSSGAFNFGSGDFTIEAWVYVANTTGIKSIASVWPADSTASWRFLVVDAQIQFIWKPTSGSSVTASSTSVISANTWIHVAVVRNGGTVTLYKDGSSVGTASISGSISNNASTLSIGRNEDSNTWFMNGYMDDLRITKGIARTILAPTVAYPDR